MQELQTQLADKDTEMASFRAASNAETDKLQEEFREKMHTLTEELVSVREELSSSRQRECELQASSEQCRALLEQQLTDVKVAHSAVQEELRQAKDREEILKHRLRANVRSD